MPTSATLDCSRDLVKSSGLALPVFHSANPPAYRLIEPVPDDEADTSANLT